MPLLRRANVYNQNYIKIRVNNLSESYSSGSLSGLFTLPGFPRDYTISRAGLFPETLRTPEPGFSRHSSNSRAGLLLRLSELPSRAFPGTLRTPEPGFSPRDSPNSRTYDITIIPGYSRTYIIIRIYLILRNKCLPRLYKLHSPPHGGFTHIILFSIIADNFLVISTMAFHIIIKLNTNDKL